MLSRALAALVCLSLVAALGLASRRQMAVWKSSLTLWNRGVALYPEDAVVRYHLGLAKQESGTVVDAVREFDASNSVRRIPEVLNARGNARLDLKDLPGAIDDFGEALRYKPHWPLPWSNRALAWLSLGNYDRALADLNEALRLDPRLAEAYVNRAAIYRAKKMPDRALADCDAALAVRPGFPLAYAARGATWLAKGRFEAAAADFQRALRLGGPDWSLGPATERALRQARGAMTR